MGWQERIKEDKADAKKARAAKAKKKGDSYGNAEYVGYVSYPRTAVEKRQFDEWSSHNPPVTDMLDAACEMGYKFSLSLDKAGGGIKAQFYSNDVEREDAGLGLSTFAASGWDATVYAVFYLCVYGTFNLRSERFVQPGDKAAKTFWGD